MELDITDEIRKRLSNHLPAREVVDGFSKEQLDQFLLSHFRPIEKSLVERKKIPVEDKISQGILDNLSAEEILKNLSHEEMELFLKDNRDILKSILL
tara:strand:- start:243 stop:533 length:291 start_codon:yes stop_codon:yes gene_type:complete